MRLPKEPLAIFVVLGAAMFALSGAVQRHRRAGGAGDNRVTAPVTAPLSRTVSVTAADLETLRAGFRAVSKREPNAGELADLVAGFVDEEMLFREATALGLAEGDRVVRRRLIEKMTVLAHAQGRAAEPAAEELRRWFDTYRHRFVQPATITFEHRFFDPARHADARADAARALAAPAPERAGDPFVLPSPMAGKSEVELAHLFGPELAKLAATAPEGRWQGPATSRYGAHILRVTARQAERAPTFEQAEKQVRADWLTVETRGQRAAAATLLPRYQVVLPDDLRAQVAGQPGLAPYLGRAP